MIVASLNGLITFAFMKALFIKETIFCHSIFAAVGEEPS